MKLAERGGGKKRFPKGEKLGVRPRAREREKVD